MNILLFGNSVARSFPIAVARAYGLNVLPLIAPSGYWSGSKRDSKFHGFSAKTYPGRLVIESPMLAKRIKINDYSPAANSVLLSGFDIIICGLPHIYNFSLFSKCCNIQNIDFNPAACADLVGHSSFAEIVNNVHAPYLHFCESLIQDSPVPVYFLESAPGNYYYDRIFPWYSHYFLLSRRLFFNAFNYKVGISSSSVIDLYRDIRHSATYGLEVMSKQFTRVPEISLIEDGWPVYLSPRVFDMAHPLYSPEYQSLAFQAFKDRIADHVCL